MMDPFAGAMFAGLGAITLIATLVPLLMMVVALIYVALRVRDARAEVPDPELGLKTAYWLFYTLGVLILHFGLTILATYWVQQFTGADNRNQLRPQVNRFGPPGPLADDWNPASRIGWSFVVAGGLLAGAFYLVATLGTRNRQWPTVRRVFTGSRLMVAGMVTTFAILALVVLLFQKELPSDGPFQATLGTLAVWLPSLAVHIFLFRWGGTPAYHVPPPPRVERPTRRPVRRYDEEDEREEAPPAAEPPPPDDDEERPRRRRPRDDD